MKKILYNACIVTPDGNLPGVTAVVIEDGRIQAIGESTKLLEEFLFCQKYDMGGKFILPGLTDAHIHLQEYGISLQNLDCDTSSKEECIQRVADKVDGSQPGEWIVGHGWDQNIWENNFGTSAMLDVVAPVNPVYLTDKSLHAGWVNQQALRLAGINLSSADPQNGRISRDDHGEPTGILLEDGIKLVSSIIPPPSVESLVKILKKTQIELWKFGLTGVHDFDRELCFSALQILHGRGELGLRVLKSFPMEDLSHVISIGLKSGFGDDLLRIGSLKLFSDGALGPHTAAMLSPFVDENENYGILKLNKEELFKYGSQAVDNGISLAVHAIGDRANHEVLEGFSDLRKYEKMKRYPLLRHRIEHVQLLHQADSKKLAELDLIASMQPIHATSDMKKADKSWGDRCRDAYAWKTQLNHGTRLIFGSDAPVESPNPFRGLYAAVTRQREDGPPGEAGWYPEQRLTVSETLHAYTDNPAYAAGMENRLGKISTGFLADLVVLEKDPFKCHPSELFKLKPQATMVAGEWVWEG
jgi:predicted amidohydrolase YtcJ